MLNNNLGSQESINIFQVGPSMLRQAPSKGSAQALPEVTRRAQDDAQDKACRSAQDLPAPIDIKDHEGGLCIGCSNFSRQWNEQKKRGLSMGKVISIHEYVLKPDADKIAFEQAIREVERRGLLQLPGLVEYHILKGIKGSLRGSYAIVWIYEDRHAWEKLWGSPDQPRVKDEYPENWKVWEEEILSPFLLQDPDRIKFTAYEELNNY